MIIHNTPHECPTATNYLHMTYQNDAIKLIIILITKDSFMTKVLFFVVLVWQKAGRFVRAKQ